MARKAPYREGMQPSEAPYGRTTQTAAEGLSQDYEGMRGKYNAYKRSGDPSDMDAIMQLRKGDKNTEKKVARAVDDSDLNAASAARELLDRVDPSGNRKWLRENTGSKDYKKGGKVYASNYHADQVKKHSAGFKHHSEQASKHAAGFTDHKAHVEKHYKGK